MGNHTIVHSPFCLIKNKKAKSEPRASKEPGVQDLFGFAAKSGFNIGQSLDLFVWQLT